jgi:Tol biopolymer transport system component
VIQLPRKLEIDDLEKFVMPSSPHLSPKGDKLAYVVTGIRDNTYFSTLYILDFNNNDNNRYFDNAVSPSWSPDGNQMLFLSDRGLKDKGTGIWVTTLCGEPRLVTTIKEGIEQPSWNCDGTKIFLTAPTVLLALATARGMALGTWSIHQSRIPIEAAKTDASTAPNAVISSQVSCALSLLRKVIPHHPDSEDAKEKKGDRENQ